MTEALHEPMSSVDVTVRKRLGRAITLPVHQCAHLIPDQMSFTQGRHAFVLEVNLVPCLCQLHVVGKELCSGKIASFEDLCVGIYLARPQV